MNSIYDKRLSAFQIVMFIVCMLAIAVTLAPVLNIVATSLSGKNAIAKGVVGLLPVDFTLDAYKNVLGKGSMIYSLFYSLGLTLFCGFLNTFLTILAAYPLSKTELKGNRVFMTLITITMYVSAGTIPTYLLIKNLGLMDTIWSLILPSMVSPFYVIILRTFFMSINKALYEASYMDGCGEWRCLFSIAVPLSTPAIATILLFTAVGRWNGVTDVLYYIDNTKLYTLQFMLKQMLDATNIEYTAEEIAEMTITPENIRAATIIFAMVPVLIVYPFVQKYFTKGVNIGGVKE